MFELQVDQDQLQIRIIDELADVVDGVDGQRDLISLRLDWTIIARESLFHRGADAGLMMPQ